MSHRTDPFWVILPLIQGSAVELNLTFASLGFSYFLSGVKPMDYFVMVILKPKPRQNRNSKGSRRLRPHLASGA